MSKKIIMSMILCGILLISGCAQTSEPYIEPTIGAEVESIAPQVTGRKGVTNQEMKLFFSKFLDIDHESLLVLNQKPSEVGTEYWRVYKAYEEKANEILGDYLSTDAKERLKKQYLHDDFHFPRFVELNDYMVTGISNVSDATITSKQVKEDSIIYEVDVIGMVDVIDLDWARQKYKWDYEKGYYVQDIFLERDIYSEDEPGKDKIRVSMTYFVEVPDGERLTVSSVKEKTGLYLGMDEQMNIKNNQFISRLSFLNAVIAKEETVIHNFLDGFMKEDYNYYKYYRKAHDTDYETFRNAFEIDLGLTNTIVLNEANYKQQFEPSIIPLKDDMESLYFDVLSDVEVKPHVSSSAKLSTYQVTINAQVTLINGQVIPYEYTYLFILDKELRISSVRLLTQQESKGSLDVESQEM